MKEIVVESVKTIRKIFNTYVTTLGLVGLGIMIKKINREFHIAQYEIIETIKNSKTIKVLNYNIHLESFSLVYGVVFFLFIAIICLRLRLLRVTISSMTGLRLKDSQELVYLIRFFPWIASPFQPKVIGPILFWSMIGIGYVIMAMMVFSHIWPIYDIPYLMLTLFETIGYIDLCILFVALGLLALIYKDVKSIKGYLAEIN